MSIGMFLDGFETLSIAAALTVLMQQLAIRYDQVGLLISASFGGMFVGALAFGRLSERFGRRNTFAFCVGLFGVFAILDAATWDFWSLFSCRAAQGLGFGGAVPVGSALIVEYLPSHARGRIYSLNFSLLFSLGFIVAPLAGFATLSVFGPEFGWRVLFLIGGVAVPYAIYAVVALPESPRWLVGRGRIEEAAAEVEKLEAEAGRVGLKPAHVEAVEPDVDEAEKTRMMELFSPRYLQRTIVVCVLFFTVAFVQYGFNGWLPTLFVSIGGLEPRYALSLSVLNGAVAMGCVGLYALTVDQFGRRNWIVLGFAISLVGIAVGLTGVLVFGVSSWQLLFASSCLTVSGSGINAGAIYLYSLEVFPTRIRSLGASFGSSLTRLGSIFAPLMIGVILQAGLGMVGVFAVLAAFCMIGLAVTALWSIETRRKALEELAN